MHRRFSPFLLLVAAVPLAAAEPARIKVILPEDAATVQIGGYETKSQGRERTYASPPLEPGKTFTYVVKASWIENNRLIVRMRVAEVRAGQETTLDFRGGKNDASSTIIFVPTGDELVARMLTLAKVAKNDVVYDLGCGDGRIVVLAAKKHQAKGVGIDIDPDRVKEAYAYVAKEKVGKLVEIRLGDALQVPDLDKATVVTTYMLPEFMTRVSPILRKQLKPGTRIVAHDFPLSDWQETEKLTIDVDGQEHYLYLYVVGKSDK
jgi:uncharacterized protein (TIGR03000 family)